MKILSAAILALVLMCFPNSLQATQIRVEFGGVITDEQDPLGVLNNAGVVVGNSTFSGLTAYDTSLIPFWNASPGHIAFYDSVTTIVTIDSTYHFSAGDSFIIYNDVWERSASGLYQYQDRFWKSIGFTRSGGTCCFPDEFPYDYAEFSVNLFDTTHTVFTDTSLPSSITLDDFDLTEIEIGAYDSSTPRNTAWSIHGDITWLQSRPVPEPASLLLLGTGLVGLRAWRKRRQ